MIREVNLVSYLPPFMRPYKEPVAALDAENPEFGLIWDATNRVFYNRFISTADEYGISRYEKMLGIYPSEEDTLEIRRMRVLNRWFNAIPYTLRMLAQKLSQLLGNTYSFSISQNFDIGYCLTVTIYALNIQQEEEVKYVLSTVVPENIVIDLIYENALTGKFYYGGVMRSAEIITLEQR